MATQIQQVGNTVRIGGDAGASYTTVSAPVKLELCPTELAGLPEERREIVNLISDTVQKKLTRWEEFTFELPQTEFVRQDSSGQSLEPLVAVADLCKKPDVASELPEITRDPATGDRRRLTEEQCRSIAENGRFSFPSRRFPHVKHIWQLPSWMVRGRKPVENDFKRRVGKALDHLLVRSRNRISQKAHLISQKAHLLQSYGLPLSIANGMYWFWVHIRGIVGAIIGLPETEPREKDNTDREEAEKQYIREMCDSSELHDCALYFDLSGVAARHSLSFEYTRALAFDTTYRPPALDTFLAIFPTSRISRTDRDWTGLSREEKVQRILLDAGLGDEHKRLVLAEHVRAQGIIKDGQDKLLDRMAREKRRFLDDAKRRHPILSLCDEWLDQWLLKWGVRHYPEWKREQEDEIIEVMRSRDLHLAATFEESRLRFRREAWPKTRASWLRDRVAAREYEHTYVIFDPRRWREGGENSVWRVRTTTENVGWRLVLLIRDTVSFLRNGLYFTFVTNLWRGPVGIQALFSSDDVPYKWEVGSNGASIPREYHKSMYTRVVSIWEKVRELGAAIEEDTSLLGKDAVLWLHYIVNYVVRGGVSTSLVIVGQPVLTVVNVAATAVITTTAVLWAPLSAFATYCASCFVYDWRSFEKRNIKYEKFGDVSEVFIFVSTESSPTWFPVPLLLFRAVLGAFEACVNLFGVLLHPIYSIILFAFACIQRGVRVGWDGMWYVFLRRFGRWPARDSFLAKRVRGAGISSPYYFRLSTGLVMRCVRARLELIELQTGREVIQKAVKRPVKDLKEFIEDVLTGLCEEPGKWARVMQRLQNEQRERMKRINAEFNRREMMLKRLTKMPADTDRIRLEQDVPPEQVLEQCVKIVETFHEERIAKLGEVSPRLWRKGPMAPDYLEVTKHLLSDLFSDHFLEPVEKSEETIELPVTFDDLINVYATVQSPVTIGVVRDVYARVRGTTGLDNV